MKAVVIVDSYGRLSGKDGDDPRTRLPEYHERGTELDVSEDEFKRASDPTVHPPAGALAKADSRLAAELSRPVPANANPDLTRAHIARLVQEEKGAGSGINDPAGNAADEENKGVDAGVARSRELQGRADAFGGFDNLDDEQLHALAKARGVDSKDMDRDALIGALSLEGPAGQRGTPDNDGGQKTQTRTRSTRRTGTRSSSKTSKSSK